jgi:dihydroxyacetone kinase
MDMVDDTVTRDLSLQNILEMITVKKKLGILLALVVVAKTISVTQNYGSTHKREKTYSTIIYFSVMN